MRIEVTGLVEAQAMLDQIRQNLKPRGVFGDVMQTVLEQLRAYAASITPVVTGRLQAGHYTVLRGLEGYLANDVPYAEIVHAMGGHRAFYDRTMREAAPAILDRAAMILVERL